MLAIHFLICIFIIGSFAFMRISKNLKFVPEQVDFSEGDTDIIEIPIYNYVSSMDPLINIFNDCPSRCQFVKHKGVIEWEKAEYVLFYGPDVRGPPPRKPRGQTWIYYNREPPTTSPRMDNWTDVINWTVTYRRDSDVMFPWGLFRKGTPSNNIPLFNDTDWSMKRLVLWLVSNCITHSKRESYVNLMESVIKVDKFGKCGKINSLCPRSGLQKQQHQCLTKIFNKYKFYLSLENSFCRDYVTEKAFKLYSDNTHTIPVVRGHPASYDVMLPPGSYLNTYTYKRAMPMSQRLKTLSSIDAERILRRMQSYKRVYSNQYCELCEIIRKRQGQKTYKRRLYSDLRSWLHGPENDPVCVFNSPKDLSI